MTNWILHICHSYYPPFLDCARQYATLFKDTEYKVFTIFLTGTSDSTVVEGVGSGEVHFLGFESKKISGLKLVAIHKIRVLHRHYQFKFCIAHRVKPTYIALLATNIPIISVHHSYNDYKRWSRRLIVNFYQSRLLILGVSDSVRDNLRRDLCNWPIERIQTLYNRIDLKSTREKLKSKTQARQSLNIPQDAWVVGAAGRLHPDKDYITLLHGFSLALPKLPQNSLLIIMGSGKLEHELKSLSNKLKLQDKVKFLGFVPNGAHYFKAFDVFALTSEQEPFGMVLLEAMAAEVPIICSNCGGGAEVARDVGLLFEFSNIDAFAFQLKKLSQRNIKLNVSAAQKKLIKEFSDEVAKLRFQKLLQNVI